MAKCYQAITPEIRAWIENQDMFFVSTAPLTTDGHINCSPKGGDSFRVLDSEELRSCRHEHGRHSIDGLPALDE